LLGPEATLLYQSQVSILGPVGYGPTTLPLRHSDLVILNRFSSTLGLGLTVETSKKETRLFWVADPDFLTIKQREKKKKEEA
jgi:hypothetical protein